MIYAKVSGAVHTCAYSSCAGRIEVLTRDEPDEQVKNPGCKPGVFLAFATTSGAVHTCVFSSCAGCIEVLTREGPDERVKNPGYKPGIFQGNLSKILIRRILRIARPAPPALPGLELLSARRGRKNTSVYGTASG